MAADMNGQMPIPLDAGAVPSAQRDEYEHLAWVLHRFSSAEKRRVLGSEGEPASFDSWRIEVLERDGQAVAFLVQAPSRRAGRRADTLDAVLFARRNLGTGTDRTLVVTSSIYAPYSFFLLGPHASASEPIEVLGTPTADSGQPDRQAQRFAQEASGVPGTAGGRRRCRGPAPDPARCLPLGASCGRASPPACPGRSAFKGKFSMFSAKRTSACREGWCSAVFWLCRDKAARLPIVTFPIG